MYMIPIKQVSIREPITFTLGWNYYYQGEHQEKILAYGKTFNLCKLRYVKTDVGIGTTRNRVLIGPDEYKNMDVRFIIKDKPSNLTEISTNEYEIWKKRFGFTIEELAKPLLARAIYSSTLTHIPSEIDDIHDQIEYEISAGYSSDNLAMLSTPEFAISVFIPNAKIYISSAKEQVEADDFCDGYVDILKEPYKLFKTDILTVKDSQSKDRLQPMLNFDN